jgi:4-hydroxybenzoate polyprenyltransferase
MKAFLQLIRFKNLLIITLLQGVIFFYLIKNAYFKVNLTTQLSDFEAFLLIICTCCMAICANVVNDILDQKEDKINRPDRPIINRSISLNTAWTIYYGSLTLGFFIAIYLGIKINRPYLIVIYPICQSILYFYSARMKSTVLFGNLIVSAFTAITILIFLIAEPEIVVNPLLKNCLNLLLSFSVFAFFINLIREIVKDIEDYKGDNLAGRVTLTTQRGTSFSKKVSIWLASFFIMLCLIWLMVSQSIFEYLSVALLIIFIVLPLVRTIFELSKADHQISFSKLSITLKQVMLAGLILLVILIRHNYT